jgi:ubiquinone/menaquinone biosynthesis C-methylase UbiE
MKSFDPANDHEAEFDRVADAYDAQHRASIRASGEDPEYFSRYKADCLKRAKAQGAALDFGCGIGNVTRHLAEVFGEVSGYDPSEKSLQLARKSCPQMRFSSNLNDFRQASFKSIVLANVLHHVPPTERDAVLGSLKPLLAPGGRLFVFEHNPLNPLTRRAVRDCEFDQDAVLLRRAEVTSRLTRAGFSALESQYIVFFPRALAPMRPLEPRLSWLPLGAQYMVSARA